MGKRRVRLCFLLTPILVFEREGERERERETERERERENKERKQSSRTVTCLLIRYDVLCLILRSLPVFLRLPLCNVPHTEMLRRVCGKFSLTSVGGSEQNKSPLIYALTLGLCLSRSVGGVKV